MRYIWLTASALIPALMLGACSESGTSGLESSAKTETVMLADFSSADDFDLVTASNADVKMDNGELIIDLKSSNHYYAGVTIGQETPWDWSQYDSFGIAMDIGNPGTESVQLNMDVKDASGAGFTRSAVIPLGQANTYYAELKGTDIDVDSGIRDNPVAWDFDGTKFTWMWGTEQLDTSAITEVSLSIISLRSDRTITLDNIRLVANPKTNPEYLTGLVDKYGQNDKADFPGKMKSDVQLAEVTAVEQQALKAGGLKDRSKFGGWLNGPKLEATGYFRSEKVGGRWAMVDPEGYLFFSNALANIRLSNTTTVTGRDYPKEMLTQRSPDDLTPEDSLGLNPAPPEARSKRFLAADIRRNMFNWLPEDDDPLGNHYGYRRSVHTGPIEHGETYSFYSANLERKYGESSPNSFLNDWREATLDRMANWGFTSFGNWVDPMFYDNTQVPYFANGWIIGDYKTVSSGDDFWSPLPDPFDSKFAYRADKTAEAVAAEVNGSPWCIGVFIDNEKSWGRMGTPESQYGIVINTMARADSDSPTKAVFTNLLKEKYGRVEKLNVAWGKTLASWTDIERGIELTDHTSVKQADYAILLEAYASEYFRVVSDAVEKYMPNHQYMGVRFASWGMTPEVVQAAGKYVDVMSVNEYREVPQFDRWDFLEKLDKPTVIGEFHMGATSDTGLFHAGLVKATDQADRARMYKNYINTVVDNPYFVGAHWFQYIDSPLTGRAYDGENYNVGFVRVTDTPYPEMVEAAKELNANLYERRFGDLEK